MSRPLSGHFNEQGQWVKCCVGCREEKVAEGNFYHNWSRSDTYQPFCKECGKANNRRYRKLNYIPRGSRAERLQKVLDKHGIGTTVQIPRR